MVMAKPLGVVRPLFSSFSFLHASLTITLFSFFSIQISGRSVISHSSSSIRSLLLIPSSLPLLPSSPFRCPPSTLTSIPSSFITPLTYTADPILTPLGHAQAQAVHQLWITECSSGGLRAPDRRYTSPLTRAMDTCAETFEGTFEAFSKKVLVLEVCCILYLDHLHL